MLADKREEIKDKRKGAFSASRKNTPRLTAFASEKVGVKSEKIVIKFCNLSVGRGFTPAET